MSVIKKLAGETAIYGISSIVGRFLNFLLTPFYTIVVFSDKTNQFGIVTELYSYIVFFLIILTFGMETGYFRFVQDKDLKNKVFSTISTTLIASSALFLGFVIFFLDSFSEFLSYKNNEIFILFVCIIIVLDVITALPFAKLRHQSRSKRFAILKIINIAVNIAFNLLFYLVIPKFYHIAIIKDIFDIEYIVIYVFISNIIASVVTLLMLLPEYLKETFSFDFSLLKRILYYSFPVMLAGLAGQINELIDRPLLRHLLVVPEHLTSAEKNDFILSQIGVYGANFKLAIIITLFVQAFRFAFEPMFFKSGKNEDSKQNYSKIMTYFLIFSLSIFLVISLYLPVFKYFIGVSYWQGLKIVPIILFSQVLLGILFNLSLWYKLSDKTFYGLIITGIGALITVGSNYILIPQFGYLGAAWTHVICYSIIVLISYFLGRKYFDVPYNIKSILQYIIFAVLLYYISTIISIESMLISLFVNTALFLLFIALVYFKEINTIKKLLNYGVKSNK
ncbi:MAG: polysaccharide biosynthesis protein [Bacteroidales bacterium]|nr:polysaccharide biosynthesis protein [Bacteroidales bacterium]